MDLSADVNDSDNRGLLRYDLISSPDGKADLNAYEGKQWNALYSTQNTQAGKPIAVPGDGEPFIVRTNDAANPAGYKAVRNFDEIYAANLNANVKEGDALTGLVISENVFEPGMATVLTVDHGDIPAQKDFYGKVTAPAEYAVPYGDTKDVLFIHQKTNTNLTGIDSFFVGVGDTEAEALKDLLMQGATNCLPLNLNKGAATEASVFIGYHYYNPEYVNTKRTKYYMESAVKDLYVYVGENPEKRLTIDKRKYTLCGNRNLNYGTGGTPMYLYQTTALINDKDKSDASYITSVAAAQYDRVPENIAENRWENLLTTEKKRINMNEGVNAGARGYDRSDTGQHLIDSRIYVYVHRNDNYVKPINLITDASKNYAADKRAGVRHTDHFANLDIHTGDEIEDLALTVKDMERDLQDYEQDLTKITAEKQRISTELALANKIQADMLPNIFPAFPDRDEFNIYASMTPAKEVGGDFYDFFFIDHDHLAMVIADVSGKGIPAAMFMVMAKGIIETQCMSGKSPAEILNNVNKIICAKNHEKMFVTVWLGILDLRSGELTASNAGHENPVFKDPDADFEVIHDKHGFVIGGFKRMRFENYTINMKPGSKLFVYTDGVSEATDADDRLFGVERTVLSLNKAKNASPQTLLETVDADVREFVGGAEQFDDLTMMCVEYYGNPTVKASPSITPI